MLFYIYFYGTEIAHTNVLYKAQISWESFDTRKEAGILNGKASDFNYVEILCMFP